MPKPGDIKYCDILGGQETNAAFVWIPPGSFWMGDKKKATNPVHLVTISNGFWFQQTPLTQAHLFYVMPNKKTTTGDAYPLQLSKQGAFGYLKTDHFRLPTEAEWEYAARANTDQKYKWAGSNIVSNVARVTQKTASASGLDDCLHRVAQLKSNSIGLFDCNGDVQEWCADTFETLSPLVQLDPNMQVDSFTSVTKGGIHATSPSSTSVSARRLMWVHNGNTNVGVRLIWNF